MHAVREDIRLYQIPSTLELWHAYSNLEYKYKKICFSWLKLLHLLFFLVYHWRNLSVCKSKLEYLNVRRSGYMVGSHMYWYLLWLFLSASQSQHLVYNTTRTSKITPLSQYNSPFLHPIATVGKTYRQWHNAMQREFLHIHPARVLSPLLPTLHIIPNNHTKTPKNPEMTQTGLMKYSRIECEKMPY